MLGRLSDKSLSISELHRFPNTPVRIFSGFYWDTLRLWQEIQQGLGIARKEQKLDGIGLDTWGVDFALLGRDGALLENPRHYRDARNRGIPEKVFAKVPRREIFAQTGIQFMQINTLYQLYAMKLAGSPALECARRLLMMPDLFHYWLTGVARSELTIASTSQFYNPQKKRWATELFDRLGLPAEILPEIVQPGDVIAPLLDEPAVPVYASGSHDTASAVAAVPAQGRDWCYISSGTWSLIGVELDAPVINEKSLALNLTNEMGAGGRVRLLKNIAGLWLLQECRRHWTLDGVEFTYEELTRLAAGARPFSAILDPDAFLEPGDMPDRIAAYCRSTSQQPPESPAEIARTILEGLALRYRQVIESLEGLLDRRIPIIHIVGGGSRNTVLNQFVADCTNRTVIAGPAEATAAGNVLIQALGSGVLESLEAARGLVRRSFPLEVFEPRRTVDWERPYEKFGAL